MRPHLGQNTWQITHWLSEVTGYYSLKAICVCVSVFLLTQSSSHQQFYNSWPVAEFFALLVSEVTVQRYVSGPHQPQSPVGMTTILVSTQKLFVFQLPLIRITCLNLWQDSAYGRVKCCVGILLLKDDSTLHWAFKTDVVPPVCWRAPGLWWCYYNCILLWTRLGYFPPQVHYAHNLWQSTLVLSTVQLPSPVI